MEEKYVILENKITEYDLLYKKWCRKIDILLKSIFYKINLMAV